MSRSWRHAHLLVVLLLVMATSSSSFQFGARRNALSAYSVNRFVSFPKLSAQTSEDFEDAYYEECSFYADATACAMETLIDVTSQDQFDFIISHAAGADPLSPTQKPHKMVLLMVHATWCRKCKYLMKQYLKVAKSHPEALCLKLNLATNADVGKKLGIRGVPLFIVYKAGKRIDHFYAESAEDLEEQVADNM